jgi:hypothetical protein
MTDDLKILLKRLRNIALSDPARDERWLEKVRIMPCCECGASPTSDPHHIFGSVHGLKSSDICTVPLCRKCHGKFEGRLSDELLVKWFGIVLQKWGTA